MGSKALYGLVICALSLLPVSCSESDNSKEERAAQFTTSTKPAPNPQREALESLVKHDIGVPAGLPGAPKYELFSFYKGEDIKQVTGVSGRSLLLSFTAPWCPHCNKMRKALQELAQMEKGNVQVIEVNADEFPVLAEEYHITKVPTTILYAEGVKLRAVEGAYSASSLRNYIRNVLSQGGN